MTVGIMGSEVITGLETQLFELHKNLAEKRKELTPKDVTDYEFKNNNGSAVKLSELFGKNEHLILIHNMGSSCPYCTMWADGINGIYQHLETKAAFVLNSPDSPADQAEFAEKNGWKFDIVSSESNSFNKDLGFESDEGNPQPGVSTFTKDTEGKIRLIAQSYFGPGDPFCSIWHFFDLLPIKIDH